MTDDTIPITELVPDERNARTRTEQGYGTLERSLREFGGMRSIVIDDQNRIEAGNGTVEAATNLMGCACAFGIGMDRIAICF